MKARLLIAALALSVAPVALAADPFAAADALFAQRENNHAKIEEARTAYLALLNSQTTAPGKIRAATQLGRLAVYQGEMLYPKTDKENRKRVFRQCWETIMEKINAAAVGENPAYYYYKGVCIAYWGEAAGTIASLPYLPTLLNILKKIDDAAHPEFRNFEGGGLYRLAAGVHSNPAARDFPGGLYNPTQALAEIEKALASPGVQDPVTQTTVSGMDFYENHRGKGTTLVELGKKAEAKVAYQKGIELVTEAIDNDNVPYGREAETNWDLAKMQEEMAALGL
jgi:tetratricopeptide (TPR) repeat protein